MIATDLLKHESEYIFNILLSKKKALERGETLENCIDWWEHDNASSTLLAEKIWVFSFHVCLFVC